MSQEATRKPKPLHGADPRQWCAHGTPVHTARHTAKTTASFWTIRRPQTLFLIKQKTRKRLEREHTQTKGSSRENVVSLAVCHMAGKHPFRTLFLVAKLTRVVMWWDAIWHLLSFVIYDYQFRTQCPKSGLRVSAGYLFIYFYLAHHWEIAANHMQDAWVIVTSVFFWNEMHFIIQHICHPHLLS